MDASITFGKSFKELVNGNSTGDIYTVPPGCVALITAYNASFGIDSEITILCGGTRRSWNVSSVAANAVAFANESEIINIAVSTPASASSYGYQILVLIK